MIRKCKLKKRIPTTKLLDMCFRDISETHRKFITGQDWHQETNSSDELFDLISPILGVDKNTLNSGVFHFINSNVQAHKDQICKTVYLIPLKYTSTCTFYDYNRELQFEPGYFFKFNDHEMHGVYNPFNANIILLSIDTKPSWKLPPPNFDNYYI
jgi:hypothetical protein